jgi:hypothetical protein
VTGMSEPVSTAGAEVAGLRVRITDSTLRDGSHAMAHQFTEEQVRSTVHVLDEAGVEVVEVSHGDGLGGSTFNYGFSLEDEIRLVAAAVDEVTRARIAVLLLPGQGPRAGARCRRFCRAHRHPLHRGRRIHPALHCGP